MSYQITYGVGQELAYETVDHAEELTARLAELGVQGHVTAPPAGNTAIRCEEWVHTEYDPEFGDMMLVQWSWVWV